MDAVPLWLVQSTLREALPDTSLPCCRQTFLPRGHSIMVTRHVIPSGLFCLLLPGCSGPGGTWAGTISDSAGVTVVSNPAEGIWEEADRWTVEVELQIGGREGDPEYLFGEVGPMAVDSRGRILVFDDYASQIKVYSPEGEYGGAIGRRGDGPGELRGVDVLWVGSGDTVLVSSMRAQRFNRFAPDGSDAGTFRMVLQEGYPLEAVTTSSGQMAVRLRPFAATADDVAENPMDAIVVLSTNGTVTDTLMTYPADQMFGPGAGAENRFFCPEMVWDLTEDLQVVFGVTDEYRIQTYSNKQLTRTITKPFEGVPVTGENRETVIGLEKGYMDEAGVPLGIQERLLNRIRFCESFPVFRSVRIGPEQSVWVQQVRVPTGTLETDDPEALASPEWDVFDSEGRFLGVVTLPERFDAKVFRGDRIYGVWRDELDVGHVLRLRIIDHLQPDAS